MSEHQLTNVSMIFTTTPHCLQDGRFLLDGQNSSRGSETHTQTRHKHKEHETTLILQFDHYLRFRIVNCRSSKLKISCPIALAMMPRLFLC